MIRAFCSARDREKVLTAIFRHTSTLGVRENMLRRYILERTVETVATPYGEIRRKISLAVDEPEIEEREIVDQLVDAVLLDLARHGIRPDEITKEPSKDGSFHFKLELKHKNTNFPGKMKNKQK